MNCRIATLSSIKINIFFFCIVSHYSLLTQFEMLTISPFNNKLVKGISHANEIVCLVIRYENVESIWTFSRWSLFVEKKSHFLSHSQLLKIKIIFERSILYRFGYLRLFFFFSTKENVPQLYSVLYTLFFFCIAVGHSYETLWKMKQQNKFR